MSVILHRALQHFRNEAVSSHAFSARYKDILERSLQVSSAIEQAVRDQKRIASKKYGPCIAFLAPPGREYVEATLASWLSGGIAVPLCQSHPREELKYVLEDSQASVVLTSPDFTDQIRPLADSLGVAHHNLGEQVVSICITQKPRNKGVNLDEEEVAQKLKRANSKADEEDGSLIIYTSGTTGRPKGALHTHSSINAQISGLCSSWEWQKEDKILHCLPLHHVHGIVNALYCPLSIGASVEFLPKFSPSEVWKHLMREENPITVFMGVPTMYNYLLSKLDEMDKEEQEKAKKAAARLRLTVSGSAACPVPIMKQWEGISGELAVKGDVLFKEYWNKPEATQESFDEEGFFLTGDTATTEGEDKCWKILGRTSTDIIKSGGYKISALQIEDAILEHPGISNCAVLGYADDALGEAIAAVISSDGDKVTEEDVKDIAGKHLPKYQIPHKVIVMKEIPRNPMGKINKKSLKKELQL